MSAIGQLKTTRNSAQLSFPVFFEKRAPCRKLRPATLLRRSRQSFPGQFSGSRQASDWRVASSSPPVRVVPASPEEDDPEASDVKSSGSQLVKVLLVALAVVSALLYGSGSLQGLKASANKSILGRSGFLAAFSLIFLSEIGDKTFFIAGLLATRVGRLRSLTGSTIALGIMTVISVGIGSAFNSLPEVLKSSLPIGQYLGASLMLLFGLRTITEAWRTKDDGQGGHADGELLEAELSVSSAERGGKVTHQAGLWRTLLQVGTLIFLAEWGDRSMLATIALGATHPPVGVAVGATLAHAVATGIAVVGGGYASKYISERTIGFTGGALFLVFAVLTFAGYF